MTELNMPDPPSLQRAATELRVDLPPPPQREPVRWSPARAQAQAAAGGWPMPGLLTALQRGARCRCPSCGAADLFAGYLRVVERCPVCAAPHGSARADDAPPYFTVFIVAHVVVLAMVMTERRVSLSTWAEAAIWLPVTVVLSLLLLRPIKGATVGLMLKVGLMKSASGE